jgi:hypothetical protein
MSHVDEIALSLYAKRLDAGRSAPTSMRPAVPACPRTPSARLQTGTRGRRAGTVLLFARAVVRGEIGDVIPSRSETGKSLTGGVRRDRFDLDGPIELLGIWPGDGDGESAKSWVSVLWPT